MFSVVKELPVETLHPCLKCYHKCASTNGWANIGGGKFRAYRIPTNPNTQHSFLVDRFVLFQGCFLK